MATANKGECYRGADRFRAEPPDETSHATDRFTVPRCDDVAEKYAGSRAWTSSVDIHDNGGSVLLGLERCLLCVIQAQRLKTETEIATGDPAVGKELFAYAINGRAGNGKRNPAWTSDRQSDQPPICVDWGDDRLDDAIEWATKGPFARDASASTSPISRADDP